MVCGGWAAIGCRHQPPVIIATAVDWGKVRGLAGNRVFRNPAEGIQPLSRTRLLLTIPSGPGQARQ